jgi:small subunit ribosomal protein S8
MNLKIIHLLISLKNAASIKRVATNVPLNHINLLVLRLLYREGLIQSFSIKQIATRLLIVVVLRYSFEKPVLSSLKIISKPSLSKYLKFTDVCKISGKFFFVAFSTDKKIISLNECKSFGIGGQLLFICG